jgi:hypothetical protein
MTSPRNCDERLLIYGAVSWNEWRGSTTDDGVMAHIVGEVICVELQVIQCGIPAFAAEFTTLSAGRKSILNGDDHARSMT